MLKFQIRTSHRPRQLPLGRWAMTQRWNDMLFAHWPVPAQTLAEKLPDELQVDTFSGLGVGFGVAPFWMDRMKDPRRAAHSGRAQLSGAEPSHVCPRPAHGRAGHVLLLAGREQPAGGGVWGRFFITCRSTGRRCGLEQKSDRGVLLLWPPSAEQLARGLSCALTRDLDRRTSWRRTAAGRWRIF